jgi:hypothetical protein
VSVRQLLAAEGEPYTIAEVAGMTLGDLSEPSCSFDLNPIEYSFSKIKNILSKLGAPTHSGGGALLGQS